MAGRNEEPGESVRVESLRAVSDCARSAAAMSSSATAVRAARMTERARHASRSCRHGRTRDGRCTRSYRAAAGMASSRRACGASRATSSALAHQPSVCRNCVVSRRSACRNTINRRARNPDTVSRSPATRSSRGVQRRASPNARDTRPRCATSSATTRSAPDSRCFTMSSMLSGEWTKSAWRVMAQSRFGRSVRWSARRSSSSRLFA